MKKFSEDKYNFKSDLSPDIICTRLKENLHTNSAMLNPFNTKNGFVGSVTESTFSFTFHGAFFPFGVACTINGTITPASEINLTTTLNPAFRILFIVWFIVITGIVICFNFFSPTGLIDFLKTLPSLIIGAAFFRLFIHAVYVVARNGSLYRIKEIAVIKEEEAC